ncbi:unnamed protein product [Microthlaspi erraticum]|uniref:F-box domain-containing protein n=1 Tax=Microthlaspi erraticum TaxID=1685480 RepID=A0A6D2LLC5_9BRAS|nr:unnamed protein product [Microthlaspi erraticum]
MEALHSDIQMKILLHLPPKPLGRCVCVSKKWASMIREKQFRDLYLLRSMTRPRMMFTIKISETDAYVHSVHQAEEPFLSSDKRRMHVPLEYTSMSQSIRGLICLRNGFKFALWNPSINKHLTLPEIQHPRELATITSFLGYDEATDVHKVLYMAIYVYDRPSRAKEFQVLTVGGSWRRVRCKHRHYPLTDGLCKGGVLYYGATSGRGKKSLVMSFNVSSEKFSVIDLPEEVKLGNICYVWKLVNYNGEVALVHDNYVNGVVRMWVRNGVSGEWRRDFVEIPRWREIVGDVYFSFRGTVGSGELVFTAHVHRDSSDFILYYNRVTQNLRRFIAVGQDVGHLPHVETFLDHVDSVFLI